MYRMWVWLLWRFHRSKVSTEIAGKYGNRDYRVDADIDAEWTFQTSVQPRIFFTCRFRFEWPSENRSLLAVYFNLMPQGVLLPRISDQQISLSSKMTMQTMTTNLIICRHHPRSNHNGSKIPYSRARSSSFSWSRKKSAKINSQIVASRLRIDLLCYPEGAEPRDLHVRMWILNIVISRRMVFKFGGRYQTSSFYGGLRSWCQE